MKNILTILLAVFALMNGMAQSTYIPQSISYQAIAKDNQGQPVGNTVISLRSSIIHETTNGTTDWEETHNVTTGEDGLFEINIGNGTRTGGSMLVFSDIDWGMTSHYLKMEIDITGGSSFTSATVMEFCAIPYAFKTSVADSLSGFSMDTLKMMAGAAGVGGCPCSLQQAYENGNTINVDASHGFVSITNADPAIPLTFASFVNSPAVAEVARFFQTNTSSTATSVVISQDGLNNGLLVQDNNTNKINTTSIWVYNYTKSIGYAGHNWNPLNPAQVYYGAQLGLGDGMLSEIFNNTSTAAAIRGQIIPGWSTTSNNAQAGAFLIAIPTNTANAVSVQTDGDGNASTFLITKPTNIQNAILTRTQGTGNALRAINLGSAGSAGSFETTVGTNASTSLSVRNSGAGISQYIAHINASSSNPAQVIENQGLFSIGSMILNNNLSSGSIGFYVHNVGFGTVASINSMNTSVVNPTLDVRNVGLGTLGQFIASNTSNLSNIVDVTGLGKGTILRAQNWGTPLDPNKHIGHFTMYNSLSRNYCVFAEADAEGSGVGSFISGIAGVAGNFEITNPSNSGASLQASTVGAGPAVSASSSGGDAIVATAGNPAAIAIYGINAGPGTTAGYFDGDVSINGTMAAITKSAIVKNVEGETRLLFCDESPEYWFGDYGFGQLANGTVTVTIEPQFLATVNTTVLYHVYIQMEGPCNNAGVYVTNKTATTFDVVQQNSGNNCNASFSYRIIAKRKGFENLRMATRAQASSATQQYMQTYFPEIITQREQKLNQIAQQHNSAMPVNYTFSTPTTSPALTPPTLPQNVLTENNDVITPLSPVEVDITEPVIPEIPE